MRSSWWRASPNCCAPPRNGSTASIIRRWRAQASRSIGSVTAIAGRSRGCSRICSLAAAAAARSNSPTNQIAPGAGAAGLWPKAAVPGGLQGGMQGARRSARGRRCAGPNPRPVPVWRAEFPGQLSGRRSAWRRRPRGRSRRRFRGRCAGRGRRRRVRRRRLRGWRGWRP